MCWNIPDLSFFHCILHKLRRNADWTWERTLICQNQRIVLKIIKELVCSYFSEEQFTLSFREE